MNKLFSLEVPQYLAYHGHTQMQSLVDLFTRLFRGEGQSLEDEQKPRFELCGSLESDESLNAMKEQVADPQSARLKSREVLPPSGHNTTPGEKQGCNRGHAPLSWRI